MSIEKCENCGGQMETEKAIEEGWIPSFWDEAADIERGVLCTACVTLLGVVESADGDMVLPSC